VNGVGVIARSGAEIVAQGVDERHSSRQGMLLGTNNPERWRSQWCLFMTAAATGTAAGQPGRGPGGVALCVSLVVQGGLLVVDVIAARCLSGRRAAAQGNRDQVWPESRREIKTLSRWLPCHVACSIEVKTP
jgi:hypothetical protein